MMSPRLCNRRLKGKVCDKEPKEDVINVDEDSSQEEDGEKSELVEESDSD
jgi:hypothetical protein